METTFLQRFAKEIHEKHPGNLDQLCFVFPSKRAGLFFKKELAKLKGASFWAPQVLTIETFIEELAGLTIISPLEQIFQLYEVHKTRKIQPQLPFEKFIDPAKIILADFNDIDMAFADAESLFENVKDYVELENWDPSDAKETSLAKKYLETFENLPVYYHAYQKILLDQNKAYQGLVYRQLKRNILKDSDGEIAQISSKWTKIYVAGLNALTTAEKWVFDWLEKEERLAVYFEAESQMMEDSDQESGRFIRDFAREKGRDFKWVNDYLTDATKDINTYAVNGNLAMSRMVGELFSENKQLTHGNETAVILADENLLMPVLESLPTHIGEVNVTLGFPLGLTSFMSFAEQLFAMQKLAQTRNGMRQFYFKDVVKVLTNPILVTVLGKEESFEKLNKQVVSLNRVWIDESFLTEKFHENNVFEGVGSAFSDWVKKPLSAIEYLNGSINKFQEKVEQSGVVDDVLTEQLYFFKTSLIKLQQFIDSFNEELSLDALRRIFKQLVSPMQVPFSGEPLAGVQIMGLLETRLLSFKNIIFVSVNEGVIPSKGGSQSFLPYALRTGFKIQTHQDRESLFAYHFYRILSQAENINLIFDTSSEGVGSNEKSRFIRQIEQEWPDKSANIKFTENVGVFEDDAINVPRAIEKTPEVIANIKRFLTTKGLSPSALNTYVESPIDFYYKNVIGIYEPKSVNEEVEHNTFGSIVHACLEEFYKPFEKRVLKASDLSEAFKEVDEIIQREFTKEIPVYSRGKHYLSFYSVKQYVKRFIKLDIDFIDDFKFPITLDKNEMNLRVSLKIGDSKVIFKGIADRVETRQGVKYIIDYKTGAVQATDLKTSSIEDLHETHKSKLVQLLMYAWFAHKELMAEKVVSGIYTLRDTKLTLLPAKIDKKTEFSKLDFEEFEEYLISKVNEMLNPEIPLERATDYQFAIF
jgi:hypothetical protein